MIEEVCFEKPLEHQLRKTGFEGDFMAPLECNVTQARALSPTRTERSVLSVSGGEKDNDV